MQSTVKKDKVPGKFFTNKNTFFVEHIPATALRNFIFDLLWFKLNILWTVGTEIHELYIYIYICVCVCVCVCVCACACVCVCVLI